MKQILIDPNKQETDIFSQMHGWDCRLDVRYSRDSGILVVTGILGGQAPDVMYILFGLDDWKL